MGDNWLKCRLVVVKQEDDTAPFRSRLHMTSQLMAMMEFVFNEYRMVLY